jgi:hypothetical protein
MKRAIGLLAFGLAVSATPAFAAKFTLACSLGPRYMTTYLTIDTDAKTVTDYGGTYLAQITDDAVTWYQTIAGYNIVSHRQVQNTVLSTYNRNTAQLSGYRCTSGCSPVPCVKAPDRPF